MIQLFILLEFIKNSPENNESVNKLLHYSPEDNTPSTSFSKRFSDQDLESDYLSTKKFKKSFLENNLEFENKIKNSKKEIKERILYLMNNTFLERYLLKFKELLSFYTRKQGLIDYTNVIDDFSVLSQKINFPLCKPGEDMKIVMFSNARERMNYIFSAFAQYLYHVSILKKGLNYNQSNYVNRFIIKSKSNSNPLISILNDSDLYVNMIMPELRKYYWQCKEKFLICHNRNQLFIAVCLILIKTFMCASYIHDILIKNPVNVYDLNVEILKFRTLFFLSIEHDMILLAGAYDNFYLLFYTFVETFYPSDLVNLESKEIFSKKLDDFFSRYMREKLRESLKTISRTKKKYYCEELDKLTNKKLKENFSCIDQEENVRSAVSQYKNFKNKLFLNQDLS
ncbi:hypothetical protein TUBRATIS_002610 [Tubulinosema ratisbonensis]|uniref:Uncharacterized protein n=1 Tax=Tubulinosema ratisbonensis TaxID=291195 RepID=A0A437AQF8_9MICR|nr:hypothetical protein TUBRATIS_002610 [Tubulinosema ratisbonensis]